MDRFHSRIAQAYGYLVCLICVIVILINTNQVINGALDLANPVAAAASSGGRYGPMNSYESYRIEARRQNVARTPTGQVRSDSSLSDAELKTMYDAERAQQLSSVRYRAMRSLVTGIVFLILGTVLFLWHWRWIRGTAGESDTVTP